MNSYVNDAKKLIDDEIDALEQLKLIIGDGFIQTIEKISSISGRVVVTGVGKSGHIARKIAATMSSLGTPAFFIHPNDAMHGDLGMITKNDVVLAISNSGESDELLRIIPNIRLIGADIIAITNNPESNLAKHSDILCPIPKVEEAGSIHLAPTSSTTVTLVLGDALSVILSSKLQFKKENFAAYHPAGSLGKKLTTKVIDVMHAGEDNARVLSGTSIKGAIFEISSKRLGATIVVDEENHLLGLVTDGDIRRAMDNDINIYTTPVDAIMTINPTTIQMDVLAINALMLMQKGDRIISCLPVINENHGAVGMITASDILRLGILY